MRKRCQSEVAVLLFVKAGAPKMPFFVHSSHDAYAPEGFLTPAESCSIEESQTSHQ